MLSLHEAFAICLIGAILLTVVAYPIIVWLVCKFTR